MKQVNNGYDPEGVAMTVPGPCTQQDAHVSAYPMCICSAGRIGTTLCLEHTCMPHEALRLTV